MKLKVGERSLCFCFTFRVLDTYGMCECSGPHTMNTPTEHGVGSVGKPFRGCSTKLDVDVSRLEYRN